MIFQRIVNRYFRHSNVVSRYLKTMHAAVLGLVLALSTLNTAAVAGETHKSAAKTGTVAVHFPPDSLGHISLWTETSKTFFSEAQGTVNLPTAGRMILSCKPSVHGKLGLFATMPPSSMDYLAFNDSDIKDDDLKIVGKIKWLKGLEFARCVLVNDVGVKELGGLQNLQRLDLKQTQITEKALPAISQLKSLSFLRLSGTAIAPSAVKQLQTLKSLTDLNLEGIPFTDRDLDLSVFPHLHSLNLGDTEISDETISRIAQHCPELNTLNISRTKITPKGLSTLAGIKTLMSLTLSGRNIDQTWVPELSKLKAWGIALSDTSLDVNTLTKLRSIWEANKEKPTDVNGQITSMRQANDAILTVGKLLGHSAQDSAKAYPIITKVLQYFKTVPEAPPAMVMGAMSHQIIALQQQKKLKQALPLIPELEAYAKSSPLIIHLHIHAWGQCIEGKDGMRRLSPSSRFVLPTRPKISSRLSRWLQPARTS